MIGDHNHLDRARSKFGEEVVKDLDFFKFKSHKISDLNYKGKLNAFLIQQITSIAKRSIIKNDGQNR